MKEAEINLQHGSVTRSMKKILLGITIVSVFLEMLIFPSLDNFFGCLMMIIVYWIFANFFLKQRYIVEYPFSFLMLMSMFLYRYLPLPSTLLSGRPVSYGMELATQTFTLETLLFVVSCLSFYFAARDIYRNKGLQKLFNKFGLYSGVSSVSLWTIGLIGTGVRLYTYFSGVQSVSSVMDTFLEFMYAPIILFFPCLYQMEYNKAIKFRKISVWLYIIFISIINLGSNSRSDMIAPFAIIVLLYLIYMCKENISLRSVFSPKRFFIILIGTIFVLSAMQRVSDAMITVRSLRNDLSIGQLISLTASNINTLDSIENKDVLSFKDDVLPQSYSSGWTEEYIDNFMLNRYANIRISDETLYFASKLSSIGKNNMREDFFNRLIAIIPQPLINISRSGFNKSNIYYSRGDILYYYSGYGSSVSLGGYRVTSHLADGLATFGIFSFFI